MMGIQRKSLANWCSHNIDLIVTFSGVSTVLVARQIGYDDLNLSSLSTNIGFWAFFTGIIITSIGLASFFCFRILKWQRYET